MEKSTCDYLKEELTTFNKQKQDLTQKIKSFCQNKEYPLNDRWNLFIKSDLGEHQSYYMDLKSVDLDKFYDNYDRYQEFNTSDVIFWLEENEYTNLDQAKEEILKSFIKSFQYDW